MSSKTAPAYVFTDMPSDEARQLLIDEMSRSEPDHDKPGYLVVEQTPDGKNVLLADTRPVRTLYHYTSTRHWERIQQEGYLRVGPQGGVALTDEPNLRPGWPNARWATSGPLDKTQVRITVVTKDADPFVEFCEQHKLDAAWVARASQGHDTSHWYMLDRPVLANEWAEIRMGDTPVGKPLNRRRTSNRPLWQTSMGGASRCDFCGYEDEIACYRYECKPFEVGDWHNGSGPDGDPREADWAACWYCSDLIQKRDILNLLARGDTEMLGQRVITGGKHGTDDGIYNATASHERVRAFFKHYTKRRWFVGKCDFCSIRGETVRWQYECGAFTTPHPMTGVVTHTDSPWTVCEMCSKLIEKNNVKAQIDRALSHQLDLLAEEIGIDSLSTPYRAQARQAMTRWVELFFKHRRGPRHLIADLPPRVEIPPASIPAQGALEQQLTLLRWLEGSDGRQYIGRWNEDYASVPRTGRDATRDELSLWSIPLRYGEAFYWEPRVAEHIRQAAEELISNPDVPFVLRPHLLPATEGFFYSDTPLGTSADHPCRAIAWTLFNSLHVEPARPGTDVHSSVVSLWPQGHGDPSQAKGIVMTFWSERPQERTLRPSGQLLWQFNVDYRKVVGALGSIGSVPAPDAGTRAPMVASMFAFIQQRIVVAGHGQPVSSASRKRIEREYPEHAPTVRVVTLRRTQRADYQPPDEPTGRTLSYQFKVHGFWRNQCFNTAGHAEAERDGIGCNDHMSIYIHEFFKGPIDAPKLPEAERVYDVAR